MMTSSVSTETSPSKELEIKSQLSRWELALYVLFTLIAALTRFWDLGSRALHHDESLHAYFSWLYYKGFGYVHDPMMHGPFLFHTNAIIYTLFGDSDYTARIVPALFGTILVPLPVILRDLIGRRTALLASFLLLISPEMLYYSRFIRNDIYGALWGLLMFAGLIRWVASRNPLWMHIAWISWVFLFCAKEISFIIIFIFASFIYLYLLLVHSKKALIWNLVVPIAWVLTIRVLPEMLNWAPLPAIPFDHPTFSQCLDYAFGMISSPQVQLFALFLIVWLGILFVILRRDGFWKSLVYIRKGYVSGDPLSEAIACMPQPGKQLAVMIGSFMVIAVPLYTSLYTNVLGGLLSGSFGQLFYWLAQHEERRGGQPWFYYAVMQPLYEPIPTLFGLIGILYGVFWLARKFYKKDSHIDLPFFIYMFLVYWAIMSFAIYSWAGEKMPWLSLHITLPFLLLASLVISRVLSNAGILANERQMGRLLLPISVLLIIAAWTFIQMASWTKRVVDAANQVSIPGYNPNITGISPLYIGLAAAIIVLIISLWFLRFRTTMMVLTITVLTLCVIYTIRSAIQASYVYSDVPREMLIYVQTTPRVPNLIKAFEYVSEKVNGTPESASIIYDSEVSWPFVWYLRNFPNASYEPQGPTSAPKNAQFVIVGVANQNKVEPYMKGYTSFVYPMRWWFPESMYRDLAPETSGKDSFVHQLGSIANSLWNLREPERQAKLWRYYIYREPDGTLDSFDMVVYVRNDLLPLFNQGRTQ